MRRDLNAAPGRKDIIGEESRNHYRGRYACPLHQSHTQILTHKSSPFRLRISTEARSVDGRSNACQGSVVGLFSGIMQKNGQDRYALVYEPDTPTRMHTQPL